MDPFWPGLTDEQWDQLKFLLPPRKKPSRRAKRRGARPWASDKKAFEALVWALGGGTLERLPPRFGSRRTACRRLKSWFPPAILDRMWHRYTWTFSRQEADEWHARFQIKRRRPFWQELQIAGFYLEHGHFYRLPACPSPASPSDSASPPPSSTPESPAP